MAIAANGIVVVGMRQNPFPKKACKLLDEKGCELGVLQGPAVWNSPDGYAVIDALLGA